MKLTRGLIVLAAAGLAAAACASPPRAVLPKGETWRAPDIDLPGTALFCDDAIDIVIDVLPFAATFDSTNVGADDNADDYSCQPWREEGGEVVYALDLGGLTDEVLLTAELTFQQQDLDLFLLDDCHSDNCLAAGSSAFTINLAPGAYFLVVDGYHGSVGDFTLRLEAVTQGLPDWLCESSGEAVPIPARLGGWSDLGSLHGAVDYLRTADCSLFAEEGGEVWYRLDLPPDHDFAADVVEPPFDAALWLLEVCGEGAEPVCLDFSDRGVAGADEFVDFTNDTGATISLALGVDAYTQPDSAQAMYGLATTITRNLPICDVTAPDMSIELTAAADTLRNDSLLALADSLPLVDCVSGLLAGGEIWYDVTVPYAVQATFVLTPADFDGVLLRFNGCAATASCQGLDTFSDSGGVGGAESLTYARMTPGELNFYLVVDSHEATGTVGDFTLEVQVDQLTPTQKATGGSIRQLFR